MQNAEKKNDRIKEMVLVHYPQLPFFGYVTPVYFQASVKEEVTFVDVKLLPSHRITDNMVVLPNRA